jgi:RNA ligase (TIGR02306 family)
MTTQAYAALMECPKLEPIPDKDRIATVTIGGYDVIVRKEDFKEGDNGLFIAVDSIIPEEIKNYYGLNFLKKGNRVKTLKLGNTWSQGLFLPVNNRWLQEKFELGAAGVHENIADKLGITKWEPTVRLTRGMDKHTKVRNWPDPRIEVYDIDSIQRPDYAEMFSENDEVVITEKIHGMNASYCVINGAIKVMSRKVCFERDRPASILNEDIGNQTNIFYHIYDKYGLEDHLKYYADIGANVVIRGEVFGKGVQDLTYGLDGADFRAFDVQLEIGKYLDFDEMEGFCSDHDIPVVPTLYRGKYDKDLATHLAEQNSTIYETQMSEGIVIRDPREVTEKNQHRRVLKLVSKRYLSKDDTNERLDE